MLIESAFFKLLHIWTVQDRISRQKEKQEKLFPCHDRILYEAQVTSEFANLIANELSAVGFHIPERFVIQNYPYPDDSHKRVDIKVDFNEYFSMTKMPASYISKNNFIEVKSYIGTNPANKNAETSTENAGRILNDILRLEFLTKRVAVKTHDVSKYILLCFDDHPQNYIAYSNGAGKKRQWIEDLLISKDVHKQFNDEIMHISKMPCLSLLGHLEVNLENIVDIPNTMFNSIKEGLKIKIDRDSILQISFAKYMVFPFAGGHQAYFFLLRIFNVKIVNLSEDRSIVTLRE